MSSKSTCRSFGNIQGGHYDDLKINGMCNVEGDIDADSIIVSGTANFEGNVKGDNIKINGAVNIEGNVKTDEITINGVLSANNIDAEHISINGIVNIEGDINAECLEANAICVFNNLYGEKIVLRKIKTSSKVKINMNNESYNNKCSQFNEIEATSIELSHTKGKRISGENIVLGNEVEIETVEYSKSISIKPDAKIKKIVKL